LKIYLSGSIRGGREFQPVYNIIFEYLKKNDYTVLAHHVASQNVIEIEESYTNQDIYTQDIQWLKECDGVIAEVSIPSLGVGYEIAYALNLGKPVMAVYDEKKNPISAMISGNTSPNLILKSYTEIQQLQAHIKDFLSNL
jgi:nucleoside 2-deoxyribosyltransferase